MHPATQTICSCVRSFNSHRNTTLYSCKTKVMETMRTEVQVEYHSFIKKRRAQYVISSCVDDSLKNLKGCLLAGVDNVYDKTKGDQVCCDKIRW